MITTIHDYYSTSDISLFIKAENIFQKLNISKILDDYLKTFYKMVVVGKYENAEDLQNAVSIWDSANEYFLTEILKTTKYEYNPIENYDRMEDTSRNNSIGDLSETLSENTINSVTTFDSNTYNDNTKNNHDITNHITQKNDDTENITSRIHGNIGVITTQTMIKEQRNVIDFTIATEIINKMINDIFIGWSVRRRTVRRKNGIY